MRRRRLNIHRIPPCSRTCRKRAHKDYLALVRTRKPSQKKICKAIGKHLNYLVRNLKSIDTLCASGGTLPPRQQLRLETIRKVYEQQKSMCHSV